LSYFGQGWFISHMSNETGQQGHVRSPMNTYKLTSLQDTFNISIVTEVRILDTSEKRDKE